MRQPFFSLLFAAAVAGSLSACDSKPAAMGAAASAGPAQAPAREERGERTGTGASPLNGIANKLKALQALPALSDDDVRQLLPAALAGRTRGPVSFTNAAGKCASASYGKAGAAIQVDVTDCAGEAGSGKYLMAYDAPLAAEDSPPVTPETATLTTQKKVAFAGRPAITRHDPVNDEYSMTFLGKDRFLVFLSGEKGVSLAKLLDFATQLDARL